MTSDASPEVLQRLLDRTEATDTLYRYCSTVDRGDWPGLRAVFTDDARVKFGNAPWIEGADTFVSGLETAMAESLWRHHFLTVYHVDIDGDGATALSYATSHQMSSRNPEITRVTIGRYHDRLLRTPAGWRISARLMELLWSGDRTDPNGRLDAMGGRGPDTLEF